MLLARDGRPDGLFDDMAGTCRTLACRLRGDEGVLRRTERGLQRRRLPPRQLRLPPRRELRRGRRGEVRPHSLSDVHGVEGTPLEAMAMRHAAHSEAA